MRSTSRRTGRARVRAELGIPEDAFVVGCISRFHPKKRNDVVIDAVIDTPSPNVHLILAGDGETEQELRSSPRRWAAARTSSPTPGREVADVLSAFDVSVFCPSPTEGAPRAVILGMLASRPCLSTGAEGVSDMITPEIGAIAIAGERPRTRCGRCSSATSRIPGAPSARARPPGPMPSAPTRRPVVAELIEGLPSDRLARPAADRQEPSHGHAGSRPAR